MINNATDMLTGFEMVLQREALSCTSGVELERTGSFSAEHSSLTSHIRSPKMRRQRGTLLDLVPSKLRCWPCCLLLCLLVASGSCQDCGTRSKGVFPFSVSGEAKLSFCRPPGPLVLGQQVRSGWVQGLAVPLAKATTSQVRAGVGGVLMLPGTPCASPGPRGDLALSKGPLAAGGCGPMQPVLQTRDS